MTEGIKSKRCSRCEKEFPLESFYRDKQSKDGFRCWCKSCLLNYNRNHVDKNKIKEKRNNPFFKAKRRRRVIEREKADPNYRKRNVRRYADYFSRLKERESDLDFVEEIDVLLDGE